MSGNSLTLLLLKTQIKDIWHMAKVNIKSEKITPFGGIYYASKAFLCAFTWQSHQRHSWCPQLHLQRLPVGRGNVSHVWRVPPRRWLRGRCQQKRVPPAGITWSPDTDEPHNRTCHKGTLPWRHGIQVFVGQCVQIQHQPKAQWPSDETQHEDGTVQIRQELSTWISTMFSSRRKKPMRHIRSIVYFNNKTFFLVKKMFFVK